MASLIVFSGPSGVGKTTLCKSLLKLSQGRLLRFVSHTTRFPRLGEVHGRDYYFVSYDAFNLMIKSGELIEYTEYLGNFYGTSRHVLKGLVDQDRDIIFTLDYEGAKHIKATYPKNAHLVFCAPPSIKDLEVRLRKRDSSTQKDLQERLHIAQEVLATQIHYDSIIVNDDLHVALKNLCILINKVVCKDIFVI